MKKILLAAFAALACAACNDPLDSINRQTTGEFSTVQHYQVNGKKDTSIAHKAVVALRLTGSYYYTDQTICTGTLVADKYVITAAHCVASLAEDFSYTDYTSECVWQAENSLVGPSDSNSNLKIAIGNNESQVDKSSNQYAIKSITYHPGYHNYYESKGCRVEKLSEAMEACCDQKDTASAL